MTTSQPTSARHDSAAVDLVGALLLTDLRVAAQAIEARRPAVEEAERRRAGTYPTDWLPEDVALVMSDFAARQAVSTLLADTSGGAFADTCGCESTDWTYLQSDDTTITATHDYCRLNRARAVTVTWTYLGAYLVAPEIAEERR